MTERYMSSGDADLGRVRRGSDARKVFILENTLSKSSVHLKFSFLFRVEKQRKGLSLTQERNQDKAERQLINCRVSLKFVGLLMLIMACHLFGVTIIRLFIYMKAKNFSSCTPKKQLEGIWHMLYFLTDPRISPKFGK